MSKSRNLFLTTALLGAMTGISVLPAAAQVFVQNSSPGSFTFTATPTPPMTSLDSFTGSAPGTYLGTAGVFDLAVNFTGLPDMTGAYSSGMASVTFSFTPMGAGSATPITSGVGNIYYSTDDPGLVYSNVNGYTFEATTLNTTSMGTTTTGEIRDAQLLMGPVPEASTVVSLGLPFLGLGLMAIRRRKATSLPSSVS